uniref:Uncharacterized protein n=1 Tax=Arundo donax TaxID=35708 RepID=A0A0A8ZDQ6_ARUDO
MPLCCGRKMNPQLIPLDITCHRLQ